MGDYCLENGNKRLKHLGVEVSLDWYNDVLIYSKNLPKLKFWRTLPSKNLGYVNIPLNQVIGTDHINYSSKKWLENLGCLKRFSNYYTNENCKKYFDSHVKKTGISFSKFGDNYIVTEGNHRTHIARFLGYQFIKGDVQEYFFDDNLYNTIEEYQRENLPLNLDGSNLNRGRIWKTRIDDISFFLHGYDILRQFLYLYKSSKPSWIKSKQIAIAKFLEINNNRDFIHIYEQRDFKNQIFKNLSGLKYDKLNKNGFACDVENKKLD